MFLDGTFNGAKKLACVECRQQKVKCNANGEYPCNRCQKRGLQCSLNPDFKRVYKRARLAEVEKQVEDLKNVLETQGYSKDIVTDEPTIQSVEHFNKAQKNIETGISSIGEGNEKLATAIADAVDGGINSSQSLLQAGVVDERLMNNLTSQETHIPSYLEIRSDVKFSSKLPSPKFKFNNISSELLPSTNNNGANIDVDDRQDSMTITCVLCRPKALEHVTLSSETINDLYEEYVNNYHPLLPFVDLEGGPEAIFSRSPPLFWTIMFVASRRHNNGELTLELGPCIKKCLAEIAISPITRPLEGGAPVFNVASVYSVQAFLIYTTWPPVTSSLSADSSWNTCGIALFSAVRIGLHSPVHSSGHMKFNSIEKMNSKMSVSKISEQVRTWICCNIVSTSVATVFGFPSFTHFDSSMSSAAAAHQTEMAPEIPLVIQQMMGIASMEEEIEKTLNSNPHDPFNLCGSSERLSLIKILAKKLDEMEPMAVNYDYSRRFMFLAVRVHLYTYYFLDNNQFSALQLEKGYMQVYNAALALLEHCDLSRHQQGNKRFQRYLPGTFVQVIWQTSCIIARIYHSPYAAVVDTEAGKRLYQVAARCLSEASILKYDLAYRASEIIRQIWHFYKHLNSRNISTTKVSIRTRFTASVLIDTLWVMREECGIRSMGPHPDTVVGGIKSTAIENSENRVDHHENQSVDETTAATTKVFTSIPLDPQPILAQDNNGSLGKFNLNIRTMEIKDSYLKSGDENGIESSLNQPPILPAISSMPAAEPRNIHQVGNYQKPLAEPKLNSSSPLAVMTPSNPPFSTETANDNRHNDGDNNDSSSSGGSPTVNRSGDTSTGGKTQADITKWDMDAVWKDVDWLMTDFGFLVNE